MTRTEIKLQKIQDAENRRRQQRQQIRIERKVSQVSSFIMVFAELLDDWIPFGLPSKVGRAILRRRIKRRLWGKRSVMIAQQP